MKQILFLIVIALLSASCAKDIVVNYRKQSLHPTDVVLNFNKVAHGARVVLNDSLIVDSRQLKKVTIQNLPEGEYKIKCSSNSGIYKKLLKVEMNVSLNGDKQTVVKTVDMPVQNGWYWVGIVSIAVWPLALIAGYTL